MSDRVFLAMQSTKHEMLLIVPRVIDQISGDLWESKRFRN